MSKKSFYGVLFCLTVIVLASCQKDYYKDTGRHTAEFNGTVMDYLESRTDLFDSVVTLIKVTGLEDAFRKEDITFFAPADSSIRRTMNFVSAQAELLGLPKVVRMDQIDKSVWRSYLTRYLFKGKRQLNDFPQIDQENLSAFGGQIFASYDGALMNVGTVFSDAAGVKYAGYRYLTISMIPSASSPLDFTTWFSANVASADIAPTNGYVHALRYAGHYFGFSFNLFWNDAFSAGIKP